MLPLACARLGVVKCNEASCPAPIADSACSRTIHCAL